MGELLGHGLRRIPSSVLPFSVFAARHPRGLVLQAQPGGGRRYGINPYVAYDRAPRPFLYKGDYRGPVPPLAYVVAVGSHAWPLGELRERGSIVHGEVTLEWSAGMASALDSETVADGRDIGYVQVFRAVAGKRRAIAHDVTFAFAFKAFRPAGTIHARSDAP